MEKPHEYVRYNDDDVGIVGKAGYLEFGLPNDSTGNIGDL